MKKYISIDIGGTAIKYGIICENAEIILKETLRTEAWKGGSAILKKVIGIVEHLIEQTKGKISGICISTAGMVDTKSGSIFYSAPLIPDYAGMEFKKTLEDKFHIPCEVENDVNCAGLAECFAGASKGSKISVCLTIGTGIGGSIIIDGKVFHGFSGSGCEVGYMHLPGGEFQDLGASSILVKKTAEYKNLSPDSIDGKYVFAQAKQGDRDCIRAIEEMCEILGMGIANICYVVNPEVVVLGGGIMAQKEYLKDLLRKGLDKYLIPSVAKHTRLAFAENQNQAGMLGAFYHFKGRH